ncbi:MAG: DNA mismatch repair protein MutS [Synergistaceae bacterium]|nr:DNA mismatch repair protein MutS [Synergistaceae bacterium]
MKLPEGVKMTPMLAQYSEWKDKYPDCVLLFRMGDFFEMFFDDAVKASEILDITLTARDQDKAIPMAGVPHHALDAYIGRLISAGLRVAICDQVTEPDGKNLVGRKVVRVVTPGTYVPQDAPEEGRLAAAQFGAENISIAFLTSGAGKLEAGTFAADEAVSHIMTFSPGEILVPHGQERMFAEVWPEGTASRPTVVSRERGEFSASYGAGWLCKRWNIPTLHSMGLEDDDPASGTAAAVLRYLEETQFGGGEHVREIRPIIPGGMLILDHSTQANLELFDSSGPSLYSVLNRCKTPMGRRLLRDWISRPSRRLGEISFRHDCVEFLVDDNPIRRKLVSALSKCGDMERAISRLSMKIGNPRDLGVVRDTLSSVPEIRAAADNAEFAGLKSIFRDVGDQSDLRTLLENALIDDLPRNMASAIIRDGFDAELDDYRDAIAHAEENLKMFETSERERTGLKVRVGKNSVFGYYIELGKNFADKAPPDYVRRQTVAGGERFVNERLKEIERRIFRAEQDIGVREETIYKEMVSKVLDNGASCQAASSAVAVLDVLCSLAEVARDNAYVRPKMDQSRIFNIRGARHPVIERSQTASPFTPNDIALDPDGHDSGCIAVITGPNMAGKSTYLRTAALAALMAHMGSFVPAEEARIGLIDRIFTRIGARDELSMGRSTFMVEMVETANILRHVTSSSLVILDEIGRGTSTYDGMSIAWAVLEFLDLNVEGRTKALFATHYHELTNLSLPQLVNLSMAVEESKNGIRFLHKVAEGPADRSYGVEVARLAGVPSLVVTRAQEILGELERSSGHSRPALSEISRKNVQKEIFFDAEREGVIEEISQCDPNRMTPIEALEMVSRLRKKSRGILGLK